MSLLVVLSNVIFTEGFVYILGFDASAWISLVCKCGDTTELHVTAAFHQCDSGVCTACFPALSILLDILFL